MNLLEKKHAPAYNVRATTITSNFWYYYATHRHKLDPLTTHGMTNLMPAAHGPQKPANQYTVPCRVSNPYPFASVQTVNLHAVRARHREPA